METNSLLVAVVQLNSTDKVSDNLKRTEKLIRQASLRGAQLVALPENFAYLRSESEAIEYCQTLDGELVAWIKDLAKSLQLFILAGSFPEKIENSEKIANTSLMIDPQGNILAQYRKIHLFDATLADGTVLMESRYVEAGNKLMCVEVANYKMGLTICYDLRFPELYRKLTQAGAKVIFVPSAFTLQTGRDHWEALLRARAIENQVYIVAPAQFGQHTLHRASYGRAMIIDPWGIVLAKAPDKECIIMAELDFDYLEQIRIRMPCQQHIKLF
ncbi:MAG: carbon-nitrogen hydrolase family protein [Acidobacteria bacterium]|nr:carbon-nitrogen hydrolase family protein [Acidobacteriota bacterium]